MHYFISFKNFKITDSPWLRRLSWARSREPAFYDILVCHSDDGIELLLDVAWTTLTPWSNPGLPEDSFYYRGTSIRVDTISIPQTKFPRNFKMFEAQYPFQAPCAKPFTCDRCERMAMRNIKKKPRIVELFPYPNDEEQVPQTPTPKIKQE